MGAPIYCFRWAHSTGVSRTRNQNVRETRRFRISKFIFSKDYKGTHIILIFLNTYTIIFHKNEYLAHHLSMFYSNDGIINFIQVIYLFIFQKWCRPCRVIGMARVDKHELTNASGRWWDHDGWPAQKATSLITLNLFFFHSSYYY